MGWICPKCRKPTYVVENEGELIPLCGKCQEEDMAKKRNSFSSARNTHRLLNVLDKGETLTAKEAAEVCSVQVAQARDYLKLLEELHVRVYSKRKSGDGPRVWFSSRPQQEVG